MGVRYFLIISLFGYIFYSCTPQDKAEDHPSQKWPFTLRSSSETGLDFTNKVENSADFNIFRYRNFYNGAGVAIGDINNDSLPDIYLTSNMGKNKLFLNKGNLHFEDISEEAGIESPNKWSTGVVMVDINHDNLLDIYVCNSGFRRGVDQKNELYINQGNLKFTEEAEKYGLDENGYTTHAGFFDYDNDGDLDAYILNNSFMPVNTLDSRGKRDLPAKDWPVKDFLKGGGDKLLRNDDGHFVDVTTESGIYNSLIGFGLGVTLGDVNGDHWTDIYISNDFFERDYLYINQKDGTFKESVKQYMNHLSTFSMGADMGDLNNDGNSELFVTDMLPSDESRLKRTTSFEPFTLYEIKLKRDFYYQFMQNTLQLNNGDSTFSEIAQYSGVSASDWSWGALLADFDNDGFRDIYISNGILQDITDKDFMNFFANDVVQKMAISGKKSDLNKILAKMPSNPIRNKLYLNNGHLKFVDVSEVDENPKSFSNGSAFGDLDNDGDLDLVVNNVNQQAFLLENKSEQTNKNNYLKFSLHENGKNPFAIGAKVIAFCNGEEMSAELYPNRGFQSSADYTTIIGIGKRNVVDSLIVYWPDQSVSTLYNPSLNTWLKITKDSTTTIRNEASSLKQNKYLSEVPNSFFTHKEDDYVDFYQEGLIIKMLSKEGPKITVGDINGDSIDDFFFGGAHNQSAGLYMSKTYGWDSVSQDAFTKNAFFEDTAAKFFDADNDGDLDLFVGSGGNNDYQGSRAMQDRIYVNDGNGNFELNTTALPNNGYNTSFALPMDFDSDGDLDLLVGSRSIPQIYGKDPVSYLYQNNGHGKFTDVTKDKAPFLKNLGMLTQGILTDINGDKNPEIILIGEWMAPIIIEIREGKLNPIKSNLSDYSGWWYAIASADVDNDGDNDLILGDRGENFSFTGTMENPAKLWIYDFDNNGTIEKIITHNVNGKDMTVHMQNEITQQVVSLKKKNLKHADFAKKSIDDLFPKNELDNAEVKKGSWFKSSIALNDGEGNFKVIPLNDDMQYSCINSIVVVDLNNDGLKDLVTGGNDMGFLPQYSQLDASYGHILINQGSGKFKVLEHNGSGLFIKGVVRDMKILKTKETSFILFGRNNDSPELYKIKTDKDN